jgi:hypothetical protein
VDTFRVQKTQTGTSGTGRSEGRGRRRVKEKEGGRNHKRLAGVVLTKRPFCSLFQITQAVAWPGYPTAGT